MIGVPYNPDVTIFLLSQSLNASQFNPNVPDTGNLTTHNLLFDTASQTLIWVNTKTNLIVQETSAGTIGGGGTLNYISKYTPDGLNIGNSLLYDNGTSVGLGTNTPNASAIFELSSKTQGFATPRMTTLQRDAIATPIIGLLVYNTSSSFFNYWDGSTWIQMDTSTGGDVSGSGTTNYATMWTDGPNSVIGNGTWYFSGNDYLPVTTGANIGDATHRIGTIYMASVFDYANNLTFYNGTTNTMTIQTDGYVNVGLGNITLGTYIGVPSISALFMNVTPTTNNYMLAGTTGGGTILNGASDVNYSVNNTSKMIMNSVYSQHYTPFGVGSIAPSGSQQFIVNGESYLKGISSNSSDYALKVDNSASSPLFYARNDGYITTMAYNDTVSFLIGNKFSGDNTLKVQSDSSGRGFVVTENSNIVSGNGIQVLVTNSGTKIIRSLSNVSGATVSHLGIESTGTSIGSPYFLSSAMLHIQGIDSTSSNFALKVDNSASSPLLYVKNDGIVSVGTASPTASVKLEVNGRIGAVLSSIANPTTTGNKNSATGINFNPNVANNNGFSIGVGAISGGAYPMWFSTGEINGGGYDFYIGTTLKMSLDSNGDFLIGNSVSNAKLNVKGTNASAATNAIEITNSTGTILFQVVNNGKLTAPALQTGNAGLSSGDMYVDTAANILANGDKVVGWKV